MHILQFFEMPRHDAIKALDIYKRAGSQVTLLSFFLSLLGPFRFHLTRACLSMQAGNLSHFYEVCKGLEIARNFQFPVLREVSDKNFFFFTFQYLRAWTILLRYNCVFCFLKPPQSFLATMEEYMRDAPQMVDVSDGPLVLSIFSYLWSY